MRWEWDDSWLDGGDVVRALIVDVQQAAVAAGGQADEALRSLEVQRRYLAKYGVQGSNPISGPVRVGYQVIPPGLCVYWMVVRPPRLSLLNWRWTIDDEEADQAQHIAALQLANDLLKTRTP